MGPAESDIDELIEFWTMLDEDRKLLVGKRGANALGFALLLKHYSQLGRFPRGRSDLSETVVEFVARQLGVDASELGFYEWSGRTIEYHRNQIRTHLGFRVATTSDQEQLTAWLASNVAHAERRPERVRDELLAKFRPADTLDTGVSDGSRSPDREAPGFRRDEVEHETTQTKARSHRIGGGAVRSAYYWYVGGCS